MLIQMLYSISVNSVPFRIFTSMLRVFCHYSPRFQRIIVNCRQKVIILSFTFALYKWDQHLACEQGAVNFAKLFIVIKILI